MQAEYILMLYNIDFMYEMWMIDFYHNYANFLNYIENMWIDPEHVHTLNINEKKYNDEIKYKDCWICLIEFVNDDDIIEMKECKHIFHKNCFKITILKCPVCRCSLIIW